MWLLNPYRFAAAYTPTDANAAAYIAAVEAADGQTLEAGVRQAIDTFVIGCKADGIWTAIKASCIMAGARTLAGALVPLVGTAPTRFGTEGGWNYNRKTGLRGNGTDNYLNSNRDATADPQDHNHVAAYIGALPTSGLSLLGVGAAGTGEVGTHNLLASATRNRNATAITYSTTSAGGFCGMSRATAGTYSNRANGVTLTHSQTSQTSLSGNIYVFARNQSNSATLFSNARLANYSIGESLNLALLDARVTTLVNAISAAIP